jgi:flagellar biosynthetic protein FliO
MYTTRIMAAAIALLIAALSVIAQDNRGVGSFDINKVRELSMNAQSGPDSATATMTKKEPVNGVFVVFRIIFTLAIIIALLIGATWLIKKFGIGRTSSVGGRGVMDILEVLPLGQNRNMVLFRVQEKVYLCGQTASTLSLIDKIDGTEAATILSSAKARPITGQFKEAFNQFITKMKNPS